MTVSKNEATKNLCIRGVILVSVLFATTLSGCGGSESGTTNPASLYVMAESGSARPLNGTWQSCFINGIYDELWELTFSGSQVTGAITVYTSTDGTCSAGGGTPNQSSGTISTDIDFTTYGWSDGTNVSAPSASQAGGTLSLTPTVTGIKVSGVPATFYYIDDTSATWCLYSASAQPGDQDSNGYLDYVFADSNPRCKI